MKTKIRRQLANRKRQSDRRLDRTAGAGDTGPVMAAGNVRYEIADRVRGISHGGIGVIHELARQVGLIDAIDRVRESRR